MKPVSVPMKLFLQGFLSLVWFIVIFIVSYIGLSKTNILLEDQADSASLLRAQMNADMMHDGVKGNVFYALVIASKSELGVEEKTFALSKAQEDKTNFLESIEKLRSGKLHQKTIDVLAKVEPSIKEYLRKADEIISMSFENYASAMALVTSFLADFSKLEDEMALLGDAVEEEIGGIVKLGNESTNSTIYTLSILVFSGLIWSIVLFLFISQTISKPLKKAAIFAITISNGDLSQAIEKKMERRQDEIGVLLRAMFKMTKDTGDGLRNVVKASREIEESSNHLKIKSTNANGTAKDIQDSVNSLRELSRMQGATIEGTQLKLDGILEGLNKLNQIINEQSQKVNDSSGAIEEMLVSIKDVSNKSNALGQAFEALELASKDGQGHLSKVADMVVRINEQSEKLVQANLAINAISSQTNLLAMNAAIEAAHAGDSGRGFAVVADEIRNLAESARKQSKDISSDIKSIQNMIHHALGDSQTANSLFKVVMDRINDLGTFEQEIKAAMNEQAIGSQKVLGSSQGIQNLTENIRIQAREMTEGSISLKTIAVNLVDGSKSLNEGVDEIGHKTKMISEVLNDVENIGNQNVDQVLKLNELVSHYKLEEFGKE